MLPYIPAVKFTAAEGDLVKPLRSGEIYSRMKVNAEYLFSLDTDSVLADMRTACDLPTWGRKPYQGWCGFHAYYLRALCRLYHSMRGLNASFATEAKKRACYIVQAMRDAQLKTGKIEQSAGFLAPDSVPSEQNMSDAFCKIHRNITGVLAAYCTFRDKTALQIAKDMFAAVYRELKKYPYIPQKLTSELFTAIAGIEGACWELYRITEEEIYREGAEFFEREWFNGGSEKEISSMESMADRYMLTGEEICRKQVEQFVRGNTVSWRNLNSLCSKVLSWDVDSFYGDEWENCFVNEVLSQQNMETGLFAHDMNLKDNARKSWSLPTGRFWSSYAAETETFADLTKGAFYYSNEGIFANLYMPCELNLREKGIRITEETSYPDDGTICFTIHTDAPKEFDFALRIPSWLVEDPQIFVNGEPLPTPEIGSICHLNRVFSDGDEVTLVLPFTLTYRKTSDDPEAVSVFYGPNLLVLCGDSSVYYAGESAEELLSSMIPVGTCSFTVKLSGQGEEYPYFTYKPLRRITDELYCGHTYIKKKR